MERQTTGANFSDAVKLSNPGYLDEILRAQPLDKSGDDLDKLFLIVTN